MKFTKNYIDIERVCATTTNVITNTKQIIYFYTI
jgi:hypothetical protein